MSYSNPRATNPVARIIRFSGAKGEFSYWDPEKGEKGEEVKVQLPLTIIPLDDTHSVGGFNDEKQAGYYSNQVRNIKTEPLRVKIKGKEFISGLYDDFKGRDGMKYQKNLYGLVIAPDINPDNVEVVKLEIMGAFLNAFIEAKIVIGKNCFTLPGDMIEGKKGAVTYLTPVVQRFKTPEKFHEVAMKKDVELQAFLSDIMNPSTPDPEHSEPDQSSQFNQGQYRQDEVVKVEGEWNPMEEEEEEDFPF